MTGPPLPEPVDDRRSARLTAVPDVLPLTDGEPLDPETSEPVWTCVECCLPDVYDGHGDGVGSCDCPRCEGGCGCRYCADVLGLHHCDDPDDEDEWEPWDDEDWLTQDTERHISGDDGTAEASRWHPVRTITVAGGVL